MFGFFESDDEEYEHVDEVIEHTVCYDDGTTETMLSHNYWTNENFVVFRFVESRELSVPYKNDYWHPEEYDETSVNSDIVDRIEREGVVGEDRYRATEEGVYRPEKRIRQ